MKHVLIIYTGGTIGMTRTDNGYAPRSGYFRAALDAISDLHSSEMPAWDFMELSPLLDSSNMTVHEWNRIAELIAQQYDSYDGFVVLHGTDTMAYTASALSFMLGGLDKPSCSPARRSRCARSAATDVTISSPPCSSQGRESCARCAFTLAESCCAATARRSTPPTAHRLRFAQLPDPCRGGDQHSIQRIRPSAGAERRIEAPDS